VLAAGAALAVLAAAGPAVAAPVPVRNVRVRRDATLICQRFGWKDLAGGLVLRNDDFADHECVHNDNDGPNFRVRRSTAASAGPENGAWPDIFAGCSYGVCSPGTVLPRRWTRLRPRISLTVRIVPAGRWDAGLDIWFGKTPATSGQATGAEMMIWLAQRGVAGRGCQPAVLAGHRWCYQHWVTGHDGRHWNYILFRHATTISGVRRLSLRPFFDRAARLGLLSRSDYLWSVQAGEEIWDDGNGLGIRTATSTGLRT